MIPILIAHAPGDERFAEQLARPLRGAGYETLHEGTILVGDSIIATTLEILNCGGPVVLCGTVRAMGTKWARQVSNAARRNPGARLYIVQMEEDADVESLSFGEAIARHWQNKQKAEHQLVTAINRDYNRSSDETNDQSQFNRVEASYRELALRTYDIVDLANLPADDRHLATRELELRRLYVPLRLKLLTGSEEEIRGELEFSERRNLINSSPIFYGQHALLRSIGECLQESGQLMILGDPGAGKSTLLRWLATAYLLRLQNNPDWSDLPDVYSLPAEDWIPILVRCRDLTPRATTLDEILSHTIEKTEIRTSDRPVLQSLFKQRIESGTALLLIDGLDEIIDAGARALFSRQLEQIHRAFPACPMIATSRIVGYRDMGYRFQNEFKHFVVADLSSRDKDDFARRWCMFTELPERREIAASELSRDIHSNERIEKLTGNPMLLTTMALVKKKIGRLPQRRLELYESAVEVLLHWRSEVDLPLDKRAALPQLEYLAYAMCELGVQQLREDEIQEQLQNFRIAFSHIHAASQHTPQVFLKLLESRTGLIVQSGFVRHKGHLVPVYEFRHLSIQEYLAGVALVQGHHTQKKRFSHIANHVSFLVGKSIAPKNPTDIPYEMQKYDSWREPLRLSVTACNDAEVDAMFTAIRRPAKKEASSKIHRNLFAALCLADEPNIGLSLAQDILHDFAAIVGADNGEPMEFREFGQFNHQQVGLEISASIWGEALQGALLESFKNINAECRWQTGSLIGLLEFSRAPSDPKPLELWLRNKITLLHPDNEDAALRFSFYISHIVRAGIDFGVAGLPEALIQCAGINKPLTHAAALALGLLNQHDKWRPTSIELRKLIKISLGPNCDDEGALWLIEIFGREKFKESFKAAFSYLNSKSFGVRMSSATTLGELGDARCTDSLVAIANNHEEDESLRYVATISIGKIGITRAIPSLLKLLTNRGKIPESVRDAAAQALGMLKEKSLIQPLELVLLDKRQGDNVRSSVINALDDIESGAFTHQLAAIVISSSETNKVKTAAIETLARSGGIQAFEMVLARVIDVNEDADIRNFSAETLQHCREAHIVNSLVAILVDREEETRLRHTVALCVGKNLSPSIASTLIDLISDSDDDVTLRYEVARLLSQVELPNVETSITNFLRAADSATRGIAVSYLAEKLPDIIDQRILSIDFDLLPPFLDPAEKISNNRVSKTAVEFEITASDAFERYKKLAQHFGFIFEGSESIS